MVFKLAVFSSQALISQQAQAISELLKMNDLSCRYGLLLTLAQAEDLVNTRSIALADCGRIEPGIGVMGKLIEVFCDSQYLNADNYAESLNELIEIFYYLKAEPREMHMPDGIISDDDIISGMKKAFETICQGSLELLAHREGVKIARSFFCDYEPDFDEDHNHERSYLDDWTE